MVSKPSKAHITFSIIDSLWVALLMIYMAVGFPLAPFHGDESMHIYSSHDYATLFIHHQPAALSTEPPYIVDTDAHLRINNGSIARYTIGLTWHIAGIDEALLPGMWVWYEGYESNLQKDNRPSDRLLTIGRIPSTLFGMLSIILLFMLGRQYGSRLTAYTASALYALNAVVLLNVRRAMQEGSMLFFGLLVIGCAARISQQQDHDKKWLWWGGLTLSAGLTLVSKHSGIVFMAAAWGWIAAASLLKKSWRETALTLIRLVGSAAAALIIFVALSPALWHRPLGGLSDILNERVIMMTNQVEANPDAPTPFPERVTGIVTQPFITPTQYFEAAFWADFDPITGEIDRYLRSLWHGLPRGAAGVALTFLTISGIGWGGLAFRKNEGSTRPFLTGITVWLMVVTISLLLNPLPWQRYYLPLIPIFALLAGMGLDGWINAIRSWLPTSSPTSGA